MGVLCVMLVKVVEGPEAHKAVTSVVLGRERGGPDSLVVGTERRYNKGSAIERWPGGPRNQAVFKERNMRMGEVPQPVLQHRAAEAGGSEFEVIWST